MLSPEILDADETAALLRVEAGTIMQLARKGELPGTRIGKSWVFLREDVMAFLKEQIVRDTESRRRHHASQAAGAVIVSKPHHGRRTALPALPDLSPPTLPHSHQR
jgi:excisionase family DNA binding protein